MADHKPAPLQRLRTFADDVNRARAEQNLAKAQATDLPQTPPRPPQTTTPIAVEQTGLRSETAAEKIDSLEAELDAATADAEIPPFHYLRETSAIASDYTDEKVMLDDAHTLKQPTKAPPIQEPTLDIKSESIKPYIPQPASLKNKKKETFNSEDSIQELEEGMIVTDQKRNRFKLVPAIVQSIKNWFTETKDKLQHQQKTSPTVTNIDQRESVIQAAAANAKLVPEDDYESTTKRLKTQERETSTTDTISITEPLPEQTPTWSPSNDPENTLTPEVELPAEVLAPEIPEPLAEPDVPPEPEPATPELEPKPVQTPAQLTGWQHYVGDEEADKLEIPSPTTLPETAPPKSEEVVPIVEPTDLEVDEKPEVPVPEVVPPQQTRILSTAEQNTSESNPRFNRNPIPEYRLNKLGRPVPKKQGTPYLTLAAVIIVAIILGTGVSVWFFTRTIEPTIVTSTVPTDTLLESPKATPLPLPGNRTLLYNAVETALQGGSSGLSEFYPTIGEGTATAELVLSTMAINAPGSMQRAVTSISFGGYDATDPVIVMRFTSFDTMFAGMLAWENSMSSDLAPLFGPATITTTLDSRVNNRDVRVLSNPQNEDVLVYGFITRNTLLIAPNRNTFSAVAPLVR